MTKRQMSCEQALNMLGPAKAAPQPPQTPWISVEDRLPEFDSGFILTYWDDGDIVLWSANKLAGGKDYVTHWMPIPEPPK